MKDNMLKKLKRSKTVFLQSGAVVAVSAAMSSAAYAIDTAAVETKILAAETDALTTGEYVIGTVASLVVIGLIIALVRKI